MANDKKTIRFVVAGLGRIGKRHAHWVDHTKGLTLAGVCDPDAAARQQVIESRGNQPEIPALEDYEALLEVDADFVVIATPSHLHHAMTKLAVQANRHVLVEKPMAGSAQEAEEMVALAESNGRILTVNQSLRYQADTVAVREIIASGELGEVISIYRSQHTSGTRDDWQIWKKYGGGALSNLGSHFIDALLLMVDSPPQSVFARMGRTLNGGDAEDWFKVLMRTESGQVAETELLVSTFGKAMWHVSGTRGTLLIEDDLPRPMMHVKPFDGEGWSRQIDFVAGGDNTSKFYADLAAHLQRGDLPPVRTEQVLQQMYVLDAVRASDASGQSMTLPELLLASSAGSHDHP